MTEKGVQLMGLIIGQSWRLFTEWKLPFTNFTPAALFFFMMFVPLMVSILKSLLSLGIDQLLHVGSSDLTVIKVPRPSGYIETHALRKF